MNQQHNTLVPYMTCKNLRPTRASHRQSSECVHARTVAPIRPTMGVGRAHRARRVARASRVSHVRSSGHGRRALHVRVKRALETQESARGERETHRARRTLRWASIDRTRDRQRSMSGRKRRLLTLDDISSRLRGEGDDIRGRSREKKRGARDGGGESRTNSMPMIMMMMARGR